MAAWANAKVPLRQRRTLRPCLSGTFAIQVRVEDGVSTHTINKRRELYRYAASLVRAIQASRIAVILISIHPQSKQDFAQKSWRMFVLPIRRYRLTTGRANDEPATLDTDFIPSGEQFFDGDGH
ncbi:hypothetical protein D3C76_1112060 [compost metagenome]